MRILRLAGRRLAASVPTLVLILIGVFLLLQFAPGDTVDAMMAQMGGGDAATAPELRTFYGLDLSVPVPLGNYLWRHLPSHHAPLSRRSAHSRLYQNRARQGARRDPRGAPSRSAQCPSADGDADRPAGRNDAGRFGCGRKRVFAARFGPPRL